MMEENFRRALLPSRGDFTTFITRPLSASAAGDRGLPGDPGRPARDPQEARTDVRRRRLTQDAASRRSQHKSPRPFRGFSSKFDPLKATKNYNKLQTVVEPFSSTLSYGFTHAIVRHEFRLEQPLSHHADSGVRPQCRRHLATPGRPGRAACPGQWRHAVDAAIAAAATLAIVEPVSNGLGSDCFAIVWDGSRLHGLNASGPAPGAWNLDYFRRKHQGAIPMRAGTA